MRPCVVCRVCIMYNVFIYMYVAYSTSYPERAGELVCIIRRYQNPERPKKITRL
jgi:hypothetical protein